MAKLNTLDALLVEAEARRAAAPPGTAPIAPSMLPPAAILEAHLTPLLRQAHAAAVERLESTRSLNDELMAEITAQRTEIKELVGRLEEVVGVFNDAVEEVQSAVGQIGPGEVEEVAGL